MLLQTKISNFQNYRIMANWASTSYAIEGSKEELNKWNYEQEDDDAFIYVHEFEVVA